MYSIYDWLDSTIGIKSTNSNNSEWICDCPICEDYGKTPDTKGHLYVSSVKPVYSCFRCGSTGTYFDLVREVTGAESQLEVWRHLKEPSVIWDDYESIAERLSQSKKQETLPTAELNMPDWYTPIFPLIELNYDLDFISIHEAMLVNYALGRLSLEDIRYYRIGYCEAPVNEKDEDFMLRLIVPVERGYFQARTVLQKFDRKYRNPSWPIEDRLFNFPAIHKYETILIGEGVFDAIALGRNAIATLSNKATIKQKERLVAAPVAHYVICYDADTARSQTLIDIAEHLNAHGKQVTLRIYKEGDPDEGAVYTEEPYTMSYRVEVMLENAIKKNKFGERKKARRRLRNSI